MSDDFGEAIDGVRAALVPGPGLEGARVPAARKGLLRITHAMRAYQQQIDLSVLTLVERQWIESEDLRRDNAANRQAVADAHARVDELEARVDVLTALTDDLLLLVERLRDDRTVISLSDAANVAQLAQRANTARHGVVDATG
jgi:hypothetical protein